MKKYYLILERKGIQKSLFPLEGSVTIGRSSSNEITLADRAVSRAHARVRFQKNSWVIEDLGSSNGIFFEGERIVSRRLQSGDMFQIGRTTLRFVKVNCFAEIEELFDTLERFATTIRYKPFLLHEHSTKPRLEQLQEVLWSIPLFEYLGRKEIEGVASAANLHLFAAGTPVIKEKGKDRSLYITLDGRVKVFTVDPKGKEIQLAVLGSSQFFGEVALLTGKARTTSVAALEKSLLLELTYTSVRRLMLHYPQINKVLQDAFQQRVEDTRKKRAALEKGADDRSPQAIEATVKEPRREEKTEEQITHRPHWSTYMRVLLPTATMLMLVLLGISFFGLSNKAVPRRLATLDPAEPVELLMDLQGALEKYAAAHGEAYPERLEGLIPDYLAATDETNRILALLDYRLDISSGYHLQFKPSANIPGGGLVATAEDIYLPEQGT